MTTIQSRFQTLAAAAAAVLLASCGGGDGGINNNVAGVTSASAATPKYGQDLIITLQGRNLDKPILAQPSGDVVNGFGCSGLTRSTEAPYVSSADTAYYRCTSPKVGDNSVIFVRPSDGVLLANVPFSTPVPQVTLTISNGAAVNGNLVLTLDPAKAPITVTNFLRYVNSGFYVDTVFHRNVPGFIIQGGGFAKPLVPNTTPLPTAKPPTYPAITLEDFNGLRNVTGSIAMARTSEPNSATSQFFINLADNPSLNGTGTSFGYAVFGSVTTGTELVTAMAAAPCSPWRDFLAGDAANACVPNPNLVVTAAVQTR